MYDLKTTKDLVRLYDDAKAGKLTPNTLVRAYKYVTQDGLPPYHSYVRDTDRRPLQYAAGYTYSEKGVNTDRREPCGKGLHVATRDWCRSDCSYASNGSLLLLVEMRVRDIAVIPWALGANKVRYFYGKFRARQFTVIAKCDWDTGEPKGKVFEVDYDRKLT